MFRLLFLMSAMLLFSSKESLAVELTYALPQTVEITYVLHDQGECTCGPDCQCQFGGVCTSENCPKCLHVGSSRKAHSNKRYLSKTVRQVYSGSVWVTQRATRVCTDLGCKTVWENTNKRRYSPPPTYVRVYTAPATVYTSPGPIRRFFRR